MNSYSVKHNLQKLIFVPASVLSAHNRNILYPKKSEFGCNCRSKTDCPLDNKCLTPKIVYQADVRNDTNDEKKFYLGVSETPFKERFRNHNKEFTHKKYRKSTELSKYIWKLKRCKYSSHSYMESSRKGVL